MVIGYEDANRPELDMVIVGPVSGKPLLRKGRLEDFQAPDQDDCETGFGENGNLEAAQLLGATIEVSRPAQVGQPLPEDIAVCLFVCFLFSTSP